MLNAVSRSVLTMRYFSDATFAFFRDLAVHNERDWFHANKARYLEHVREPFLALIRDVDVGIKAISPHYRGIAKANGGSLFRINRDVRFSNNKMPYKTWAGARFTHGEGGRGGAPSFYLHIQPGQVFMGAGIWHPEPALLNTLRHFIANNPSAWSRLKDDDRFRRHFRFGGSSLKRHPRGFEADHPLIEDLKRKDFVVANRMSEKQALSPRLLEVFLRRCEISAPFVDYLCAALDLEF